MKKRLLAAMLGAAPAAACSCNDHASDPVVEDELDKDDPRYCAGGRYDESTGLCWQHPRAAETHTWKSAMDYCGELTRGGHSDWSLPTLQNFIDLLGGCESDLLEGGFGWCNPCEESPRCSALLGGESNSYWTSTSSALSANLAWGVPFGLGRAGYHHKTGNNHVRCVRSGR